MNDFEADYQKSVDWARNVLADPYAVILDTETTGLGDDAEIIQIAIIDMAGNALLNTLVKPSRPIPPGATQINGISDADVADAPTWPWVYGQVLYLLRKATRVVIYNANYDMRILRQTCHIYDLPYIELKESGGLSCAMHWYAQWYGDFREYGGDYRWQPLRGGDHSALGDCKATLKYIQCMVKNDETRS